MEAPTRKSSMKKADMKIVLLGDMDVGKTSLVLRYIDRKFKDTVSTIGASFLLKQWGHYNIAIWDTAGEEKYHGLNAFYCRNTSVAILVFDLTSLNSFEALRLRYIPFLNSGDTSILKVVVGSKSDLLSSSPRKVLKETALKFTRDINNHTETWRELYFETSSRTGHEVDNVFESIFERAFPGHGKSLRPNTPNGISEFHQLESLNNASQENKPKSKSCCST